jgi:hypothetical protein
MIKMKHNKKINENKYGKHIHRGMCIFVLNFKENEKVCKKWRQNVGIEKE